MEAETFQRPNWALFMTIIVLLVWAGWFFKAQLSVFEISTEAHLEGIDNTAHRLVADFSPVIAIERIRLGQSAWLHIDQYPAIPITVAQIHPQIHEGYIHVIFELPTNLEPRLAPGMKGTVEVEVERLSPAALLLRIAKQWLVENSDSDHVHLEHSH